MKFSSIFMATFRSINDLGCGLVTADGYRPKGAIIAMIDSVVLANDVSPNKKV